MMTTLVSIAFFLVLFYVLLMGVLTIIHKRSLSSYINFGRDKKAWAECHEAFKKEELGREKQ